jgi:hypothetical protein
MMARQLSKDQIQTLKDRIREARVLYPRMGERQIYEQLKADYPEDYGDASPIGALPYPRFRNHYDHAIRGDGAPEGRPGPGLAGIPPRPGPIAGDTTLARFLSGRKILFQAEERRKALAALLDEANRDLLEVSVEMTRLAEELKEETDSEVRAFLPAGVTMPEKPPLAPVGS